MKKILDFETFNELYQWVMITKKELEFPICLRLIDKPSRSIKQNSLYWKWLGEIERQSGTDKEDWHYLFKLDYAVPILRASDVEYNQMILAAINVNKSGLTREYEAIKRKIVGLTSTTDLTTVEFDQYLKKVWDFAIHKGWILTHPADQGLDDLINSSRV